ncbi:MAG: hypothetical protein E7138_00820 [Rikenellaceae bacterium]|nr:hypothetical protein [Rikenellaceae bacterium]
MRFLKLLLLQAMLVVVLPVMAQLSIDSSTLCPSFAVDGRTMITTPDEGLWAVATKWENDWMTDWVYAKPERREQSGEWTILSAEMPIKGGVMFVRDSYRQVQDGLVQCRRRYEWRGEQTLEQVNLAVRWRMQGNQMQTFVPGVIYYGNKNGAKVNPNIIPVYNGKAGEFAIFEEHRYPIPFVMLENTAAGCAAAVHTTPSPVRGAVLADQWWSMGVEAADGYTDFVLYSGPIGYNGQHAVAKALQRTPMKYTNTYINMEPGRVVEKEFYIELYPIKAEGTGFQQPIYTALDLYKPYDADSFTDFATIVEEKYRFAKNRWIDLGNGAVGFDMYEPSLRKDIVMGWCGQAGSPGYALQVLAGRLDDADIEPMVQQSLDFLTTYPVDEESGMFKLGYNGDYHSSNHVSCGQAMYNFAKAIVAAKKNKGYDTERWREFLRKACDGQSRRILSDEWSPRSTDEAFYVAPLAIASKLFKNKQYLAAAEKASKLYAERHLKMNGCYWGGTLDATCEDKEGAWAAFQAFIHMYEYTKQSQYLEWAKHAMDVCLSYVVVWDIPLPAGRLADYNFRSTGWTVVSPQNQHIDVYGVLFAPEVYRMGKYLDDERLCKLSKVMYRTCFQLTNAYGSQGEQLQQTNFAQRGDMSNVYKLRGGYSEGWTVFWITAHFLNAAARFEEMGVEP